MHMNVTSYTANTSAYVQYSEKRHGKFLHLVYKIWQREIANSIHGLSALQRHSVSGSSMVSHNYWPYHSASSISPIPGQNMLCIVPGGPYMWFACEATIITFWSTHVCLAPFPGSSPTFRHINFNAGEEPRNEATFAQISTPHINNHLCTVNSSTLIQLSTDMDFSYDL